MGVSLFLVSKQLENRNTSKREICQTCTQNANIHDRQARGQEYNKGEHNNEAVISQPKDTQPASAAAGSEALGCHCACVDGGMGGAGREGCRSGGAGGEKRRKGICCVSLASFQNCLADMLIYADTSSHEQLEE